MKGHRFHHPSGSAPPLRGISSLFVAALVLGIALFPALLRAQSNVDYGDAPSPYPTLVENNGARHTVNTAIRMGQRIDTEVNGQPNGTATGDDVVPTSGDDEDGVALVTALIIGSSATVIVNCSTNGFLNAWIDFSRDGDWLDTGEQILLNRAVVTGNNSLNFNVPTGATIGFTYARFRFSTVAGNTTVGLAVNGEVEDYQVLINTLLDFGDAPAPYPTLLTNNGARHTVVAGVRLGEIIDAEADGQPNSTASGDDIAPAGVPDDEDGVTFTGALQVGQAAAVRVVASVTGRLNAWLDFNGNGSWLDAGDRIFTNTLIAAGPNNLIFVVPDTAVAGPTYARFRFNLQGDLRPEGPGGEGEVEDYPVTIFDRTPPEPCDNSNKGSDFWLTFPGNHTLEPDEDLRLSLCLVGLPGVQGTVSIPGLNFTQNFQIPASMSVMINLPDAADLGNSIDQVEKKGIHVTAKGLVGVYGFNHIRYTTDAFTALPSPTLGKEYIVLAYGNVHSNAPALNGTQFAMVACDSNTTVSITLPFTAGGHTSGVPYQVVLQAGETYQFRDTQNTPHDVTGTFILADKPIAVFGSHQCANIATKERLFCDYVVEQLLPNQHGGTNFVAMPLKTRTGDTFRYLALQDKTDVFVNGALVAANLDRGHFREMIRTGPSHIRSTQPIMVAQYANSANYDNVVISDPFMTLVPPTRLFLSSYMICVPTADFPSNHVNIVIPSGAVGTVTIDGVAVPAAAYSVIPGSGYSGAQPNVSTGPHLIQSAGGAAGPIPFGLIVYGFNEFDSYGYPGGFALGDTTPPTVTCLQSNITVVLGGTSVQNCFALVPDVRSQVIVTDNCQTPNGPQVQQIPPPQTPLGPGVHIIVVRAQDSFGNVGECELTFTVVDPSPITITCPTNQIATCTSSAGARVNYTGATARSTCRTNVPVTCNPPSGSMFPPGQTTVVCQAPNSAGQTPSCTFLVTVRCLTGLVGRTGDEGTVTWHGGGVLEAAPTPTGRWTTVASESPHRFTITPGMGTIFFRVRY